MARNLVHARADDMANETENVSHNTLKCRENLAYLPNPMQNTICSLAIH